MTPTQTRKLVWRKKRYSCDTNTWTVTFLKLQRRWNRNQKLTTSMSSTVVDSSWRTFSHIDRSASLLTWSGSFDDRFVLNKNTHMQHIHDHLLWLLFQVNWCQNQILCFRTG